MHDELNGPQKRMVVFFPFSVSVSVCPSSFTCSLNCRLGYQTDSNGCLLCQCQSCPSMEQCHKSCPSGLLKDLFGCEICECNEPCPPLPPACNLYCPPEIGFMKSKEGCPLCQCAQSNKSETTSSCQVRSTAVMKNDVVHAVFSFD